MNEKRLTGKILRERIKLLEVPRPPDGLVERFRALGDASGVVSDILDELGIAGVVGASTLRPTVADAVIVGSALTVKNVLREGDPHEGARQRINKMAEFEAHNLALPGDVLVIEGVPNISNMGGISAQTGKRQGELGAIVQGGVRDVAHSRSVGYPVWSSEVTPVTGKWRIETVEINGTIVINGVRVASGDIVLADSTGVCFIPLDRAGEVLRLCEKKVAAETEKCAAIDAGTPVPDLPKNA